METIQRVFQIEQEDNVATALEELIPGALGLLGDGYMREAETAQRIPKGHKIALRNIRAGEDAIKYGMRIVRASKDTRAGERVHLRNTHSVYDRHSSYLDVMTGMPKDIRYEQEAGDG